MRRHFIAVYTLSQITKNNRFDRTALLAEKPPLSENTALSHLTKFQAFIQRYPDIRYLDVMYADLSNVIRGKRYPINQAHKVFESGVMTPGSSFLLAVTGESMNPMGMGFSDGDPDEVGMPLDETLAISSWAQVPTAQVMLTLQSLNGEPYYYEPRNVLKRVLSRFHELGLKPVVAFELEFYLLDQNRSQKTELIPPLSPLTGQSTDANQVYSMDDVEDFSLYLDEVTRCCHEQGVATGAISGEYAPGQFEINLQHSDDPLKAADQCIMFRRVVQSVAKKQGLQGTFMAKPYLDNSGSGLHLHISLINDQGENVFDGKGEYGSDHCASDLLRYSIGGLREHLPESMSFFAPNANSYRRYVPNLYVPVTASWGYENRSVAIRIPKSPGASRRLEHRVAGADANPYLTLAALLGSIHDGIGNQTPPGEPATGNAGESMDSHIPFTISDALDRTEQSEFFHNYFGKDYVMAYTSCKRGEYDAFVRSGDKETQWYL